MAGQIRFHAMQDDRAGRGESLIVCRCSKEAAELAASQAERDRAVRDIQPPLITWVVPVTDCGHP